MAQRNNDCTPCRGASRKGGFQKSFSWLPGILLVVLPKCPFCFMAFSSTMLLCGEGVTMTSERMYQSDLTIALSALFCAIALLGIMMVRRDIRTVYALMIAISGTTMIMTSVLKTGGLPLYYAGTFLIFLGVWLNSSLLYILRKAGIIREPVLMRLSSK
jgi:hypothetical protein